MDYSPNCKLEAIKEYCTPIKTSESPQHSHIPAMLSPDENAFSVVKAKGINFPFIRPHSSMELERHSLKDKYSNNDGSRSRNLDQDCMHSRRSIRVMDEDESSRQSMAPQVDNTLDEQS